MKTSKKKENSATEKIEQICQKNCRVCNSEHLKEIHTLRDAGRQYQEIADCIKKKYDYDLSPSGLCRHFKNYNERRRVVAAEIMSNDLVEESTEQARHTKQIVALIDRALDHIKNHAIRFDISDLEKLFKIRHQILGGDNSSEGDLVALFQTAIDKHGVDVNQGILFKNGRPKN